MIKLYILQVPTCYIQFYSDFNADETLQKNYPLKSNTILSKSKNNGKKICKMLNLWKSSISKYHV